MTASDPQAPILVAYSSSKSGRAPVEFGIAASDVTGAPLTILTIRHGGPMADRYAGEMDDSGGEDALAIKHLRLDLQRRSITADIVERESRTTAGGMKEALDEFSPSMVVLGATERGSLGAAVLGSTIERVVHEAACPVAVVPHDYARPDGGVQIVGVAYVPTDEGREALRAAAAIARAGDVKLRAVAVLDPALAGENAAGLLAGPHHEADPASAARGREGLGERSAFAAAVAELGVESETDVLFESDPARALIDASHTVDLLVVGSRGQGPRRAVILGSVSRKVAEGAACPVLIVPRAAAGATESLLAHSTAP